MKRNSMVSVAMATVLAICGVRSALADVSLSNNVNLSGLNFGYNTYTGADGSVSFNANLSTLDTVTSSFVSISRDTSTPNQGWIFANFYGSLTPAQTMDYQNQSLSVNHDGINYNLGSGIGSYTDSGIWSTANAYASLSGVTPLYASGNYNEYYSGGGMGKGVVIGAISPVVVDDVFSASVQWRVRFDDPVLGKGIEMSSPGVSTSVASSVPEPASLAVFALGATGLLIRRRRTN